MKLAKARIDPTIKFVGADDVRDIWWYPVTPEELTTEQRRLVMGCVIELIIKIVFKSHYYEWNGEYYH